MDIKNVVSFFDGMSCGQIALERCGFELENYFAYEIDKYAMKVTQANYPNTKQMGSVVDAKLEELPPIDLLIGGSPCQGFSFAGKQLNFDDPRSALFFEFVKAKEVLKPKYFLLENVKMKKEYQDVITSYMGVEPIEINSALVSAQNRKRLYWTNIPNIEQPEDRGILLKDILEDDLKIDQGESKILGNTNPSGKGMNGQIHSTGREKSPTLTTNKDEEVNIGYNAASIVGRRLNENGVREDYNKDVPITQCLQVKHSSEKSGCLTTVQKDNVLTELPPGRYVIESDKKRVLKEALKGVHTVDDSCKTTLSFMAKKKGTLAYKKAHSQLKGVDCKSGCLTTSGQNLSNSGATNIIQRSHKGLKFRSLTPIECERLQTVPDNYTNHVSNTQRYKMLGNGWTVEVIAHIFESLLWV